jgi:hypothetical protein
MAAGSSRESNLLARSSPAKTAPAPFAFAKRQGMEKGKQNEQLGQGANQEQKGMTRGAQEEKRGMEQKGAQQERGLQENEKDAQEERGTKLKGAEEQRGSVKGAQEERGTKLKGAQEQRGTSTTEQSKTGVNTNVGTSGSRGASVQLSEDQRSQRSLVRSAGRGLAVTSILTLLLAPEFRETCMSWCCRKKSCASFRNIEDTSISSSGTRL